MKLLYMSVCVAVLMVPAVACANHGPSAPVSTDEDPPSSRAVAMGVTGAIRDESGKPLEAAMIVPRSLDPNGPAIPEIAIVSDVHGRYVWPLRPGRYELTARADGYEEVTRQVTVSAGTVATLDFVLRRDR